MEYKIHPMCEGYMKKGYNFEYSNILSHNMVKFYKSHKAKFMELSGSSQ